MNVKAWLPLFPGLVGHTVTGGGVVEVVASDFDLPRDLDHSLDYLVVSNSFFLL
jgi:hypothetical protein